ncbi:RWD domain-containing protein [Colletotrichum spaethianum]|uniref:RWD domain-containing protein n=1 Tax=Colletotrichum spaethianum TaxID=700344 RepID=A0AA37PBD3_9PEZI|nr:RWD domain-containing protein [Colletotrichum spaethianum]GKT49102.1 RWD domain-containing protein [Colletotrichum spaethianum]
MAASPSWHLLPTDLIEHQIGQIDLLTAMYPTEEEVTIEKESEHTLTLLKTHLEDPSSSPPSFTRPPQITVLLTLTIAEQEDSSSPKTLQLDINVPFSHDAENTPEEAPQIKVRICQPAWLSRAATAQLNAKIPEGEEDLFSTIEVVKDSAAEYLEQAKLAEAESLNPGGGNGGGDGEPLVRVWFYFPSISTRSKRDDFIINAPGYNLTGFLYAGKPGLLCLEGGSQKIDDYMKFIKTESWGDIPAHHKKVSERHREKNIATRVFSDMQEITDSVGERRGQRANRGDMKAVEGWLVERGLGDAFAKVLM